MRCDEGDTAVGEMGAHRANEHRHGNHIKRNRWFIQHPDRTPRHDQAGKTIEELAPETATAGAAAPDPSNGDVPITAPADADTGGDAEEDAG
mgnify:CR=1 FL=1